MSIVLGEEPKKKSRYVFQFQLLKEKFAFNSFESESPSVIIIEDIKLAEWQSITFKIYLFECKTEDQILSKLIKLSENQSENDVTMAKISHDGKVKTVWNLFNTKVIKVFIKSIKEDYQEVEITVIYDYAVKSV